MTTPNEDNTKKEGLLHIALNLGPHTCPWWFGYVIDNPIRNLIHDPEKILGKHVSSGQTAIDIGCGFGYFSIALARLVGPNGKVIALDVQSKMIEKAQRRSERKSEAEQIEFRVCSEGRLGVEEPADFVLAFWMVHEVADQRRFFSELKTILKDTGSMLIAEPKVHVSARQFGRTVEIAEESGFRVSEVPAVRFSRAAVFKLL